MYLLSLVHCSSIHDNGDLEMPKCPPADDSIKTFYVYMGGICVYIMEYYPAMITWMDLECVMLSVLC